MKKEKNKTHYHIVCKKPELLVNYGFVKSGCGYAYRTESGRFKIEVWDNTARNRTANKMTFPLGTPKFTMEIAYLMANLLKDGIVEFVVETDEDVKQRKIERLEKELRKLKGENK